MPLALIALTSCIVIFMSFWLIRANEKYTILALGCVIGGAIGNIIDRIRFGAVVDFLDFHVSGFHWPAFNLADSTIFIGVVILIIGSIVCPHPDKKDVKPLETQDNVPT